MPVAEDPPYPGASVATLSIFVTSTYPDPFTVVTLYMPMAPPLPYPGALLKSMSSILVMSAYPDLFTVVSLLSVAPGRHALMIFAEAGCILLCQSKTMSHPGVSRGQVSTSRTFHLIIGRSFHADALSLSLSR